MKNEPQLYVSQPSDLNPGMFEVAKFSYKDNAYIPTKEKYWTAKVAEESARKHNEEEQETTP